MITQRFKEIDKSSISIIVDLDLAGWFSEEYTGSAAKDLDVDLMLWQ